MSHTSLERYGGSGLTMWQVRRNLNGYKGLTCHEGAMKNQPLNQQNSNTLSAEHKD
jgi:hypothetical protein